MENNIRPVRKLQFSDTFRLAALLKSAGINKQTILRLRKENKAAKDEIIKEYGDDEEGKKAALEELQNSAGIDIILMLIDTLPSAEQHIYALLSSFTDRKPEEIAKFGIQEAIELIMTIYDENKAELSDFFISLMNGRIRK